MEMPRAFSMSIQSDTVPRRPALPCTAPAWPITRACSARASVSVDLPASGWLMTAKVRRRAAWASTSVDGWSSALGEVLMDVRYLLRWCRVYRRLYGGPSRSDVVEQLGRSSPASRSNATGSPFPPTSPACPVLGRQLALGDRAQAAARPPGASAGASAAGVAAA